MYKPTSKLIFSNLITTYPANDSEDENPLAVLIAVGIVIATVIVLAVGSVAAAALLLRKYSKKIIEKYNNDSYAILCREPNQQVQQRSLQTPHDLYDRIELSPSTGQTEFISKTETNNTNNPSPHHCQHNIIINVETEQPKLTALQISTTSSKIIPSYENESNTDQLTYAVVNKKKKKMPEKEPIHCTPKGFASTGFRLPNHSTNKEKKSVNLLCEYTATEDV